MSYLPTIALAILAVAMMDGCSTDPDRTVNNVRVQTGMSREELKFYFGDPLRVEPAPSGGENWYYRFATWNADTETTSGASADFGTISNYVSANMIFSKTTAECPVQISSGGYVVEPVPSDKVIRN